MHQLLLSLLAIGLFYGTATPLNECNSGNARIQSGGPPLPGTGRQIGDPCNSHEQCASQICSCQEDGTRRCSNEYLPQTNDRIAIVGAGTAGMYMAYRLRQRGYNNIKIFEKTGRVGGKSYTIWRDEVNDAGESFHVPHEMGACYLSQDYTSIMELASQLGCRPPVPVTPGRAMFDSDLYSRSPFSTPLNFPPTFFRPDINLWVGDNVVSRCVAEGTSLSTCATSVPTRLGLALQRYSTAYARLFGNPGVNRFPLDPLPDADLQEIQQPFGQWLESVGAGDLKSLIVFGMSAQGYGLLEEIPTFYGLIWITPNILAKFLAGAPAILMFPDGFSCLWDSVHAQLPPSSVVFDVDIRSITRNPEVQILYRQGSSGATRSERFDYLILASNPREATSFMDYSSAESELFSSLQSYTLVSTLYSSPPIVGVTDSTGKRPAWFDAKHLSNHGVYSDRHSGLISGVPGFEAYNTQTRVAINFYNTPFPNEGSFPYFPPSVSTDGNQTWSPIGLNTPTLDDFCHTITTKGLTCNQFTLRAHFPWKYFPHFDGAGIVDKKPWKLMDVQGKQKTWYIGGGAASFESVLDVALHVDKLLHLKLDN